MTPSPPDEREAIVRWLRLSAKEMAKQSEGYKQKANVDRAKAASDAWEVAASAIERGDHLSEQGEG